jgi:hypothetical protein
MHEARGEGGFSSHCALNSDKLAARYSGILSSAVCHPLKRRKGEDTGGGGGVRRATCAETGYSDNVVTVMPFKLKEQ